MGRFAAVASWVARVGQSKFYWQGRLSSQESGGDGDVSDAVLAEKGDIRRPLEKQIVTKSTGGIANSLQNFESLYKARNAKIRLNL